MKLMMVRFALAGLFWPITAVIAGIGLLIYLFVQMYRNSAMLREAFAQLGKALGVIAEGWGIIIDKIFGIGEANKHLDGMERWGNRFSYIIFGIAAAIEVVIDGLKIIGAITGRMAGGQSWVEASFRSFKEYNASKKYMDERTRVQPHRTFEHDYMSARKYTQDPKFPVGATGRSADISGLGAIDTKGKREFVPNPNLQVFEGYLNIAISDSKGKLSDSIRLNVGSNFSNQNPTTVTVGDYNEAGGEL
jgi:hypothetical protein